MCLRSINIHFRVGDSDGARFRKRVVRIQKERSKWLKTPFSPAPVVVSWHPSAILRATDGFARRSMQNQLREDPRSSAAEAGRTI